MGILNKVIAVVRLQSCFEKLHMIEEAIVDDNEKDQNSLYNRTSE